MLLYESAFTSPFPPAVCRPYCNTPVVMGYVTYKANRRLQSHWHGRTKSSCSGDWMSSVYCPVGHHQSRDVKCWGIFCQL